MQVLASLRRRTKTGVSVWHFCQEKESNQFFAVGGDELKVISATDRSHLRQIHENFKRYGYKKELPPLPRKQMLVADPWESSLPLDLQLQLASL